MSSSSTTLKKYTSRYLANGCGSCTYLFGGDRCYHRQSINCRASCTCPPLICGLPSAFLQILYPESVTSLAPISWPCTAGAVAGGDDANAKILYDMMVELAAATRFWKRVCIGLGIVCGLLLAGLVFALLR